MSTKTSVIKKKVISLGSGQANFLLQLYGQIKQVEDNYTFHIDSLTKFSNSVQNNEDKVFDGLCNFKKELSVADYLLSTFKLLGNKVFVLGFLSLLFFEKNKLKKLRDHCVLFIKAKSVSKKFLQNSDYSIYHFHLCFPRNLAYIYFLPKGANIVCSTWGSDLMRTNGVYNYYLQKEAFERAKLITTQSLELQEVILSKFSRDLKPKIRICLFSIEEKLYKLIDHYHSLSDEIIRYKEKFSIGDRYVITVGHNASEFNNHVEILTELNKLNSKIKSRIFCVIPLTYGAAPDGVYINKLNAFIKELDFECVLVENFLPWEDLALLRLATDIMIHLPESDAMSGAATEAMYAGSLLITGSWLPYKNFTRSGLEYLEISSTNELSELVTLELIKSFKLNKETIREKNRKGIITNFFPASTTEKWVKIYKELSDG
jgi:glycosyltransferase involved in cell wall biosynthesis